MSKAFFRIIFIYLLTTFSLIIAQSKKSKIETSISNQILYSTVKIDLIKNNRIEGSGTGFVFSFIYDEKNKIPCVISNRHVFSFSDSLILRFKQANIKGEPIDTIEIPVIVDSLRFKVIFHPDSSVDLAALPLNPIELTATENGDTIYYRTANESLIPSDTDFESFRAVEDILLVGYPLGIYDIYNHNPIFRKGITATDPSLRYNNRNEFLIDAACYPGSSGSPVFLTKSQFSSSNQIGIKERTYLIGILFGGIEYPFSGDVKVFNIPINTTIKSFTTLPINLGVIIKSNELFKIKETLINLINSGQLF